MKRKFQRKNLSNSYLKSGKFSSLIPNLTQPESSIQPNYRPNHHRNSQNSQYLKEKTVKFLTWKHANLSPLPNLTQSESSMQTGKGVGEGAWICEFVFWAAKMLEKLIALRVKNTRQTLSLLNWSMMIFLVKHCKSWSNIWSFQGLQ